MNDPAIVLTSVLDAWLRRRHLHAALRRLGWALGAAALLAGTAMACDLAGDPAPWLRVALAGAGWLALAAGAVAALPPPLRGHRAAARELERAAGLAGEPLSGALALSGSPAAGTSAWMAGRTLALAAVTARSLDLRALAPGRSLRPLLAGALGLGLALAAAVTVPAARAAALRAAVPWRELPAPGDLPLAVAPGDTWQAFASRLELAVVASPQPALAAELVWADGRSERRELVHAAGTHRLALGPLTGDLRWRVRGPGLASPWHQARLVPTPRVTTVRLRVVPPSYTGLPPEALAGGDAEVIAGSRVEIEVGLAAPPPVAAATTAALVVDDRPVPLALQRDVDGELVGRAALRVDADLAWHLRLIVPGGSGGVEVEPPQRWRLRARLDLPPQIAARAEPPLVAPGQAARIVLAARDDVALAAMWLEVGEDGGLRIALPVPEGARVAEAAAVLVPDDLGAGAGDRIALTPVARDRAGRETRGEPVALLVGAAAQAGRLALTTRLAALRRSAAAAVQEAADSERAWRNAGRTWRSEDPTAGAPGLRAAGRRAGALAEAAAGAGDEAATAALLANAPGNLARLAERARALRDGALALARLAGEVEAGTGDALGEAHALARQLVGVGEELAGGAALAACTAEVELAIAEAMAARSTLTGAVAVLRAERAWLRPTWRSGLLGRFWRAAEPGLGEPAVQTVEVPTVRTLHGVGRPGWCARWEGEVHLAKPGRWTFACNAVGGVRLRVAGRALLAESAWERREAQTVAGTIELAAGWVPIAVEYVAAASESRLALTLAPEGGEPVALGADRLRHRVRPGDALLAGMASLPPNAAPAAAARARRSADQLLAATERFQLAVGLALRSPPSSIAELRLDRTMALAERSESALADLRNITAWDDAERVDEAADAAGRAIETMREAAALFAAACLADRGAVMEEDLGERLRAASEGGAAAERLGLELTAGRARFILLAGDPLLEPAARAAALAAAWAHDGLSAALRYGDTEGTQAAAAAAAPALALAARHAEQASAGVDAAPWFAPGWPPVLLPQARDRLRAAAEGLRAGGAPIEAVQATVEAAWAAELEAQRPGTTQGDDLRATAEQLRRMALVPDPEALHALADLFVPEDAALAEAGPSGEALAAARAARSAAALLELTTTARSLAAAVPDLHAAGLPELAAHAATLADRALSLAAAPEAGEARALGEALAATLAAPLARQLAVERIPAGGPAAMAGRCAAQAAAAAHRLAAAVAPVVPANAAQADQRRSASGAEAEAAATALYPEELRAVIRAYLRRIGDGR